MWHCNDTNKLRTWTKQRLVVFQKRWCKLFFSILPISIQSFTITPFPTFFSRSRGVLHYSHFTYLPSKRDQEWLYVCMYILFYMSCVHCHKDMSIFKPMSIYNDIILLYLHNPPQEHNPYTIQSLIDCLRICKLRLHFKFSGNIWFPIIGPNLRKDRSPKFTVLTLGLWNLSFPLTLRWVKMSCIKMGDKPFFTLYISIASWWIFLWWKDNESSFLRSSSKEDT